VTKEDSGSESAHALQCTNYMTLTWKVSYLGEYLQGHAADSEPLSSLYICFGPLSFLLVFASIVGTHLPNVVHSHGFHHLLPSTQGIVVLCLQLVQNFGLSFWVHFCFANMAFSLFLVPSWCSVTIRSIMSLDVTFIHASS